MTAWPNVAAQIAFHAACGLATYETLAVDEKDHQAAAETLRSELEEIALLLGDLYGADRLVQISPVVRFERRRGDEGPIRDGQS